MCTYEENGILKTKMCEVEYPTTSCKGFEGLKAT
jgi:hypothetical protein